jgi:Leucine-rich repeat (LRR) protein
MDANISDPLPVTPRRGPWDWLKDDPNFPSAKRPAPKRRWPIFLGFLGRWFRPRLFLSTWLFLLLAGAALAILEIPGRRTGFTTYAHGWPFAYLTRDYRQDRNFPGAHDDRWTTEGWLDGVCGKRWIDTGPAAVDAFQESFARDGFPLSYEQQMSPWAVNGATWFNGLTVGVDIGLTIFLLVATAWASERWRRRRMATGRGRLLQVRLRTFLLATMIMGPMLGITISWFQEYRTDRRVLDGLQSQPGYGGFGGNQFEAHWLPPRGIPESLLKVGPAATWFERVDTLRLTTPLPDGQFNDAAAKQIIRLPKLRRLVAEDVLFLDDGLERLADAPSITELSLKGSGITAAGLKHLARLRGLTTLQLESFSLNDEAIEQLNNVRSLEELTLWRNTARRAMLHDLEQLQSLYIDCFGGQHCIDTPVCPQSPFDEVLSMKSGEAPKDGFWHPEIRLVNLPKLQHLFLDGATLSRASVSDIGGLPAIETLLMTECEGSGRESLILDGRDALRSATVGGPAFAEVRLQNLPQLVEARIWPAEKLATVRIAQAPELLSIQLDGVPSLSLLEFAAVANVKQLALSPIRAMPEYWQLKRHLGQPRPVRFELRGLTTLPSLRCLALPDRKLDSAAFDEIGTLADLTSLDLSGTWMTDGDLARLKPLVNLESLDLSGTDVTVNGLDALSNMPRLQSLNLNNTMVIDDDEGLMRLQLSHPNLSIDGAGFSDVDEVLQHAVESSNGGKGGPTAIWCQPSWIPSIAVTDRALACLDLLDRLPSLNLWGCHITDAGLDHLKKLVHLRALNLDLTHITDAGLARLADLKSLEALGLADTLIQGAGLKQLRNLPALKSLDLSGCDITDADLKNLQYVPNLERLWLAGTKITDAGLAHLALLPKLRSLDVSQTRVTDAGLVRLEAIAPLVVTHKPPASKPSDNAASPEPKWPGMPLQADSPEQQQLKDLESREAFWSGLFPPDGGQLPSRPRD